MLKRTWGYTVRKKRGFGTLSAPDNPEIDRKYYLQQSLIELPKAISTLDYDCTRVMSKHFLRAGFVVSPRFCE